MWRNTEDHSRPSNHSWKSYLVIPDCVAHVEGIVLQAILGVNSLLVFLIFYFVLLSLLDHALNFILAEAAFIICDDNLVLAPCGVTF